MIFRAYKCIRQEGPADCGAAALATVALHHGLRVNVEKVRAFSGTTTEGTNLAGVVAAAKSIGMSARAVRATGPDLTQIPLPAIAHVETDGGRLHFVVVHRIKHKHVIVADPEVGIRRLSLDAFLSQWSGYLVLLVPQPTSVSGNQTAGSFQRFVALLRPQLGLLWYAFACAILISILGIATSFVIQLLIDSVLVRGETHLLNSLGIGMVLVLVFRLAFAGLRQYFLAFLSRRIDLQLTSSLVSHLMHLPIAFFTSRRAGEVVSRIGDAERVRQAISGTTTTAVVDVVLVVIMMGTLWFYDTGLAVIATAMAPLLMITVAVCHPLARKYSSATMEHAATHSAHLVEDVSAIETIKAYGCESDRIEEGEKHLVNLVQSAFRLEKLGISMSSLGGAITGVAGLVVLWYGGHRVIEGELTIGQLMFFYTLLGYLLEPLERLASLNLQIQEGLVALDRIHQILDLDPEQPVGDRVRIDGIKDSINLQNVSFSYGRGASVLRNVDLTIPKGKTIAIVGESGCGKSTLLQLLLGFHAPTTGKIHVDGIDLRDIDVASLRSRLAIVQQDGCVFGGTVRENITLGCSAASMQQVIEAASVAGLTQFINDLPDRFETRVGERGANLSGGQRQRLAIARAVLRNPDLLIFDEATSHLDVTTERTVHRNLRQSLRGKTVIIVAHRLCTVRDADLIYVMEDGEFVERGSHNELLRADGKYAQLWKLQEPGNPSLSFQAEIMTSEAVT